MNVWLPRGSCAAVLKYVFQTTCFSISEGSHVPQKFVGCEVTICYVSETGKDLFQP